MGMLYCVPVIYLWACQMVFLTDIYEHVKWCCRNNNWQTSMGMLYGVPVIYLWACQMVFLTDIYEHVKWCCRNNNWSADWAPRRPWSTPGWTVTGCTWTCWLSWRPSGWGSVSPGGGEYIAVLRIRIRRSHMFLGLLDPDPQVKGINPDPTPDLDPSK